MKNIATTIALSLALVASADLLAFSPGGRGGGLANPFKMAKLAHHLDLSAEQRDRVEALAEEARDQARAHADGLVQIRYELRSLRRTGEFDEPAVRRWAKLRASHIEELMVIRARTRSRIRAILTPEQRQQFDRLGERRRRDH